MPLAIYFPVVHGPLPPWLAIVIGVIILTSVAGLASRKRPGYGSATGRVVEHRAGKRPTIIEFTPEGTHDPVQFKQRGLLALGTALPVSYSLTDPRNASVVRVDDIERKARPIGVVVGILIGVGLLVIGILAYV